MSAMRIYQRMLYVGLGGTGLKIGMQLEKALRAELCGPSGTALQNMNFPRQLEPFQLPSCLQFVYLDFDESARSAAKNAAAERVGESIAALNTQAVGNLTPHQGSYQGVAETLRIHANEAVDGWLPPKNGEPNVAPLSRGAGELPTAGRAALFETFRVADSVLPVEGPLSDAIARLNNSRGDLLALAGPAALNDFDIFVGFSVAGGTGAGIFYDVLRILADACQRNIQHNAFTIFPLVVLPSAFEREYEGKKRPHMLNGGQALRELFEMIDNRNTGNPNRAVTYPGDLGRQFTPDVPVPTSFLFSRPEAVALDDLHRSIVSFVVSNIGTVVRDEGGAQQMPRPLMANLIDEARHTNVDANDGIGQHPASTALAAEMRIPLEEIAEILSRRLLAEATREMLAPAAAEDNGPLFDRFAGASGLDVLVDRKPDAPLPTAKRVGAKEINSYLHERNRWAVRQLNDFHENLQPRIARLATDFDYVTGFSAILNETDVFRAQRVVLGHPAYESDVQRIGLLGVIVKRAEEPPKNPDNYGETPPEPISLRDTIPVVAKLGLNNPKVVAFLERQNAWYLWKTKVEWYDSWRRHRDSWQPQTRKMRDRVEQVVGTYVRHMEAEPESFRDRCASLYDERTGVVYFLPDGRPTNDLDSFYRAELLPWLSGRLRIKGSTSPARILSELMSGRWADAFEQAKGMYPEAMMEYTLAAIRTIVREALSAEHGEPLMPSIQTLLRNVAYNEAPGPDASAEATGKAATMREMFTYSLGSLIPGDFRPPGRGPVRVDVFYPSTQSDDKIESFLERTCLPAFETRARFHPLDGINFISVVLRRVSEQATAISEYRQLMMLRGQALLRPQPTDHLPWRQRLGYDPTWVTLRPSDRIDRDERVKVLFRILNSLHDGLITVTAGSDDDPETISIVQPDNTSAGPLVLELRQLRGGCSSWASVVSAYERYALGSDDLGISRCEKLMEMTDVSQRHPSALYRTVMSMRHNQRALGAALRDQLRAQNRLWSDPLEFEFWDQILPKAMQLLPEAGRSHQQIDDADGEAA